LLYAKTDEEIVPDNDYMMGGNRISVKTLNLNADFSEISSQLNRLAEGFLQKVHYIKPIHRQGN
jgi:5-methylcytosine-specific restriction enzyme subunit McrC